MKKLSRIVVVLGSHRCGTSVCAHALEVLGIPLGTKLMPGVSGVNPRGFFEDLDVVALNTEMLKHLGIEWSSLANVGPDELARLRAGGWVEATSRLVREKLGDGMLFGFKDPRIARLLPIWKEAFASLKVDPRFVICVRDPLSAAESLHRRDGIVLERGLHMWLQHYAYIVAGVSNSPHVYVEYDKLLERPDQQLQRMARALGLQIDPDRAATFKTEFLDRELRHARHKAAELRSIDSWPIVVKEAYDWLAKRVGANTPSRSTQPRWVTEALKAVYKNPQAAQPQPGKEQPSGTLQVFLDSGQGFNETESVKYPVGQAGSDMVVEVALDGQMLAGLRVDPYDGPAAVRFEEISIVGSGGDVADMLPGSRSNADFLLDRIHFFSTDDPQLILGEPRTALADARTLRLRLCHVALDGDALRMVARQRGDADRAMRAEIETARQRAQAAEAQSAELQRSADELSRQLAQSAVSERDELRQRVQEHNALSERFAAQVAVLTGEAQSLRVQAARGAEAANELQAMRAKWEHEVAAHLEDAQARERFRLLAETAAQERDELRLRAQEHSALTERLAAQTAVLTGEVQSLRVHAARGTELAGELQAMHARWESEFSAHSEDSQAKERFRILAETAADERDELRQRAQEHSATTERLAAQIAVLTGEVQVLRVHASRGAELANDLQAMRARWEAEIAAHLEESKAKERFRTLAETTSSERDDLRQQREELLRRVQEHNAMTERFAAQIAVLTGEIQVLRVHAARGAEVANELQAMRARWEAELVARLEESKAKERFQSLAENTAAARDDLRQQREELRQRVQEHSAMAERFAAQIATLTGEVQSLRVHAAREVELGDELQAMRARWEAQVTAQAEESQAKERFRVLAETAAKERDELRQRLDEHHAKSERLAVQVATLTEELQLLKAQDQAGSLIRAQELETKEHFRQVTETVVSERDELREQLQAQQLRGSQLVEQVASLTAELQLLGERSKSETTARTETAEEAQRLRVLAEAFAGERDELRRQLAEVTAAHTVEAARARDDQADWTSRLERLASELTLERESHRQAKALYESAVAAHQEELRTRDAAMARERAELQESISKLDVYWIAKFRERDQAAREMETAAVLKRDAHWAARLEASDAEKAALIDAWAAKLRDAEMAHASSSELWAREREESEASHAAVLERWAARLRESEANAATVLRESEAQVADLRHEHDAQLAALRHEHEAQVAALHREHEAQVAAALRESQAHEAALVEQWTARFRDYQMEHASLRRAAVALDIRHARRIVELEEEVRRLQCEADMLRGRLEDLAASPMTRLLWARTDADARPATQTHAVPALLREEGTAFLRAAYAAILGREPDAAGLAHYMRRMEGGDDKIDVLYQLSRSKEARARPRHVSGLNAVLQIARQRRLPTSLRWFTGPEVKALDAPSQRAAIAPTGGLEHASGFDWSAYAARNPDVTQAGIAPWTHYLNAGWEEARALTPKWDDTGMLGTVSTALQPSGGFGVSVSASGAIPEPTATTALFEGSHRPFEQEVVELTDNDETIPPLVNASVTDRAGKTSEWSDATYAYFLEPVDGLAYDDDYRITRLMKYLWDTRPDLQAAFDLEQQAARVEFSKWYLLCGAPEYKLPRRAFTEALLARLSRDYPECHAAAGELPTELPPAPMGPLVQGANLVGYAAGEFGMGELARSAARGLAAAGIDFGIMDVPAPGHGTRDTSVSSWLNKGVQYDINVFGINADVLPSLFFSVGSSVFEGKYNVGLWAWELENCPPQFDLAFRLVDEVWANSEFSARSLRQRSPVPVYTLPLAVTAPALDPAFSKSYFGLPEAFTFMFSFDAVSYMERKNPIAVVRAFRQAFEPGDTSVHLVLKTMNTDRAGPLWHELLEEVGRDQRITILDRRLAKEEVRGLTKVCDVYVSLHRAEGFGFGVAEAMAYGRPVVCTNYSGTREFATEQTACVVDYKLIPVSPGAYPFGDGQRWADPDVAHAAILMRRLRDDDAYRSAVALAGQRFVQEHLSDEALGRLYSKRLAQIRAGLGRRQATDVPEHTEHQQPADGSRLHTSQGDVQAPAAEPVDTGIVAVPAADDEIVGSVDVPQLSDRGTVSDDLVIEGWAAATSGIKSIDVLIDGRSWGSAHHGLLRPDILAAFPQMEDAARSGFFYQQQLSALEIGTHTAVVKATSAGGKTIQWEWPFEYLGATRYRRWIEDCEQVMKRSGVGRSGNKLGCTVIVRSTDATASALEATLASLKAQTCKHVDVVVVDPASWQAAASRCTGHVVTVIDAGDVFRPWAIALAMDVFGRHRSMELVYGDCDHMVESERSDPVFKPGWSPVFLDSFNYIGKPWFAETKSLRRVFAASGGVERRTEYELVKSIGRRHRVCHIPAVMLSLAQPAAIPEAMAPRESPDRILPKASIIIPTRLSNLELVERCFEGLMATNYPSMEVVVVVNNATGPVDPQWLAKWPFKFLQWEGAFNWSAINNYGAAHSQGEALVFMNDDVEPLTPDWLHTMVATLLRYGAGAVGAHLLYPNRSIQHLGVNLVGYGGGTRHLLRFCSPDDSRHRWLTTHPREVSAVTGACLLTPRQVFDATGRFDESYPLICNDADYCLRLGEHGRPVLVEPRARLTHHEGVSRAGMSENADSSQFWKRWGSLLKKGDPYANPNLDEGRDDWSVGRQPVAIKYRLAETRRNA